ncbi:hypothetical protein DLD14_06870 [Legionella anisa]|nr:hypothetical protein DLD14_06870 [Legionella anisa]
MSTNYGLVNCSSLRVYLSAARNASSIWCSSNT